MPIYTLRWTEACAITIRAKNKKEAIRRVKEHDNVDYSMADCEIYSDPIIIATQNE